ncbi:MAG: TAT-variant-translocated molybdopterin oxidoreductase, partial [Ferruginibacter sp.]
MMNKYWQNFGQLNESEAFTQAGKDEFQEPLVPFEDLEETGLLDGKTPRRDFLKYLGFSTAAAALAASCEMPVRKAVPYLNRPDNVIPGVPNYYASTYVNGGDAISVVVKQRDGRPIKIEGNELCPINRGGTNAQAQASVLDLYDTTRLRHPLQRAGNEYKEVTGFDAMDNMVANDVASLGGRPLVLLTSTINSPSTQEVIRLFLAKYPGSRHVQYDAVSHSGMLLANEASHGKRTLPSYNLDKAKLIVSLGADFLGTWLSPTEFNRLYAVGRKVTGEKPELSRHVQFESMMSLTGSNADDRYIHAPSQTGAIALALLQKMGGAAAGPAIADAALNKGIEKTAALLAASKGSAVVLCGSNDVNIQMVVNALNEAIGANGTIIDFNTTNNTRKGIDADIVQLTNDMASGAIGGLLVYDCNPVYSYADSAKFAAALSKLPLSVSFNSTMDETTELCKYLIPSHHWLESWGDAEPKSGNISLIQPVINPLFKTRPFQSSLLKWAGVNTGTGMTPVTVSAVNKPDSSKASDTTGVQMATMPAQHYTDPYENFYTKYWSGKLGSTENWEKA